MIRLLLIGVYLILQKLDIIITHTAGVSDLLTETCESSTSEFNKKVKYYD